MENFRSQFLFLSVFLIQLGCGGAGFFVGGGSSENGSATTSSYDPYSLLKDKDLAHCNEFEVSTNDGTGILAGQVMNTERYGIPDPESIDVRINTISPSWISSTVINHLQFHRLEFRPEVQYQDETPYFTIQSNNILSLPVTFTLRKIRVNTKTGGRFQAMTVLMTLPAGGQAIGRFLIPDFESDPTVFRGAYGDVLGQLHPFFNWPQNNNISYQDAANAFCF